MERVPLLMRNSSRPGSVPDARASRTGARKGFLLGGSAVLLVVASSVAVVEWQEARKFDAVCDGTVTESAVRHAMPDGQLDGADVPESESEIVLGRLGECKASAEDDSAMLNVTIGDSEASTDVVDMTRHQDMRSHNAVASPLGNGWSGMFTAENQSHAHVTVELKCRRSAPHKTLLIDTAGILFSGKNGYDDSAKARLGLARAGTAIARAGDKKWKCGADLGGRVSGAPSFGTSGAARPLARASGTCRGVRSLAASAEKWGIDGAVGTDASRRAPGQDCLLVNSQGQAVYRLSARYGALAEGYRDSSRVIYKVPGKSGRKVKYPGWAWAGAECAGTALFTAGSLAPSPDEEEITVSAEFEKKMLGSFAGALAEQRGCRSLALPQ